MFVTARILAGARVMAGLNRAQLAREAGISVSALGDIEHGRSDPRNSTVVAIAAALAKHHVQVGGMDLGIVGSVTVLRGAAPWDGMPVEKAEPPSSFRRIA